jgi:hypothetical protein
MKNNNVITIAKLEDADEIMKFIDNEWKKGHILGVNKKYFLYEYANQNFLNFVISKNNNKINGILGFLRSSSDKNATVWTTMWKASRSSGSATLGIHLLNYLRDQGYQSVMSNGINQNTEEIYKYFGFNVGFLKQYFIPNKSLKKYKIAIFPKKINNENFSISKDNNLLFKKVELQDLQKKFNFRKYLSRLPYKNIDYFNKRFFEHPIYSYDVYGIFDEPELKSILVTRTVEHEKSTCMRIVDFYGQEDTLNTFAWYLSQIMYLKGHEYIDIFSSGLNEGMMLNAGFKKLDITENEVVIPNYFEPFIQSNVSIRYFTDSNNLSHLRIYKADGDQDRPCFSNTGAFS